MALKKRHNQAANPDNAFTLTHDVYIGSCCDDAEKPANECNYALTLVKAGVSSDSIVGITLGGTAYAFDAAVDTTQSDALIEAALRTQIEAVITDNFSREDGWDYTGELYIRAAPAVGLDAGEIRITMKHSQLVFTQLTGAGGSPSAHAFVASNCKTL